MGRCSGWTKCWSRWGLLGCRAPACPRCAVAEPGGCPHWCLAAHWLTQLPTWGRVTPTGLGQDTHFNSLKLSTWQAAISHYIGKTIITSSLLHMGIAVLTRWASLYRIMPQPIWHFYFKSACCSRLWHDDDIAHTWQEGSVHWPHFCQLNTEEWVGGVML